MLVFNNGNLRPDGAYTSVDEVSVPLGENGLYAKEEFLAIRPAKAVWSYTAPERSGLVVLPPLERPTHTRRESM